MTQWRKWIAPLVLMLGIAALRGQTLHEVKTPITVSGAGQVWGDRPGISGAWQQIPFVQNAPAKPICGAYVTQPQPYVEVLQISCVDFAALRRVAPSVVWPEKPQTQVLVHLAGPGAVRIKVGEQTRWDEATKDAYGHWVVLLAFDGIEHTAISVTPYKAIE